MGCCKSVRLCSRQESGRVLRSSKPQKSVQLEKLEPHLLTQHLKRKKSRNKMSKGNHGAESYLELKSAFSRVDKKKTGKIDVKQFKDLLTNLAGDDHRYIMREVERFIPDIFVLLDADEDGKLSERELCSLAMYGSTSDFENLMMTVCMYAADKDNNGWLTAAELKEMLLKMAPEDEKDSVDELVKMLMMMISTDDDTKVSIDAVVDS